VDSLGDAGQVVDAPQKVGVLNDQTGGLVIDQGQQSWGSLWEWY
jgi:hypothetical protein